jgi:hypothetical protein
VVLIYYPKYLKEEGIQTESALYTGLPPNDRPHGPLGNVFSSTYLQAQNWNKAWALGLRFHIKSGDGFITPQQIPSTIAKDKMTSTNTNICLITRIT